MKTFKAIALVLILLAGAALTAGAAKVEVRNPGDKARAGEVVAIDWKLLQGQVKGVSPENARVRDAGGKVLLSQAVDNDGDGATDQLLFLADLPAGVTQQFEVLADSSLQMPASEKRAYARYVPERKDDFAWENDMVAFRAYGPGLRDGVENCGVDCFMKRVPYPIIDQWYAGEKKGKSYHIDFGQGYDGYKVGSSLGCGGSAVWLDGAMSQPDVFTSWKQFANGPVRAVFELTYGPWDAAGKKVVEKKLISIDLGKRMFRVDESFLTDAKPAKLEAVIGVTTHEGRAEPYCSKEKGYLYAWEKIDNSLLGTGVAVAPDLSRECKLIDSKKQDQGHELFVISVPDSGSFTYYAGFGWEKAGGIKSREEWESYLEQFVKDLKTPLEVKVK